MNNLNFKMLKSFTFFKLNTILPLTSILFISSCGSNEKQEEQDTKVDLPTMVVESSTQSMFAEYPASIESATHIQIRPQVSGILTQIFVDEGQFVSKGQALFKIDDRLYVEQFNQAQANLASFHAALENAELEVEKKTRLVETGVLTEHQLKIARSNRAIAKANVQQGLAALQTAKINVEFTTIRASSQGYIGRIEKKQGSIVSPSDEAALANLSDIAKLRVYFSLSERDFIAFSDQNKGESFHQILNQLPPVHLILSDESIYDQEGKIDMIDGQFDKTTGSIMLRATFDNPEGVLRYGNTGKIRLERKIEESVLIPQSAILEIQDKVFVYTVDAANKVKRVVVELAGKNGSSYLIKKGITKGSKLVIKGFDNLKDGQEINPITAE